jgi:hypothetical protein
LIIGQRLVHKLVPETDSAQEIIPIEGGYKDMVKSQFGDLPAEFLSTLPFKDSFRGPKPPKEPEPENQDKGTPPESNTSQI